MFFKSNPRKKLQQRYETSMKEAMELQRSGKIPEFARKSAEAESILKELQALDAS